MSATHATPAPAEPSATAMPAAASDSAPGVVPAVRLPAPAGSRQQELSNQARASAHMGLLAWNACLAAVAALHAAEMASALRIYHGDGVQRDLACGLRTGRSAENVGLTSGGADDRRIFTAFMQSPGHRANIMGPYRYIGTAWIVAPNGTAYIAVEFS
jgi:uncharacterized protein YkwD